MSELPPERRIYLDFDGVMIPYWRNPFKLEDEDFHDPNRDLERQKMKDGGFYYPAIVERIGQLAAAGVVVLPSSGRSLLVSVKFADFMKAIGAQDASLSIDNWNSSSIERKIEAVYNNWNGIVDESAARRGWETQGSLVQIEPTKKPPNSKAVWVDDYAHPSFFQIPKVKRLYQKLNADDSIKIVKPDGRIGLTLADIDEIEAFLQQ